jgi:hypothetical protein
MDNCVKDNKNQHLLGFLSLLMARDVSEEAKLGFLVVGQTHEDIDGCFGYLSKKLREENNYILIDLMKAFMISQERLFIPQLIQKILDFKSWVLGYLKDGPKMLVGHTDMNLFYFFVDSLGWPMMQYKVSPTNMMWSPINGPLIKLWKTNLDGLPKLPTGVPSLVLYLPIWGNDALKSVEREKFITFGLSKCMDLWKVGIVQSSIYEMKMKPYVEY